jgi:tetratricopeptide (TPR) repeat protein
MKYNRLLNTIIITSGLSFFLLFFSVQSSFSQQPKSESQFRKAIELFETSNYIASGKVLNEMLKKTAVNDPIRFDLEYYRLMCLVKQNNKFAESEINEYLSQNGGSPWENNLWFELAKMQFNAKKYKIAAKTFSNVDQMLLSPTDAEDFRFFSGYSYFESGDYKKASQYFFDIKKGNSMYATSASYYWGYINYVEGNYETALQEFKKLENNRQFSGFISYYTTQIYYIQGKYEKVIEIGEKIIYGAPAEQKNELMKILGDAYFETGQYISAIKFLDAYKGLNGRKTREDFYRLGYSFYQSGNYPKAADAFEKATTVQDELGQNAFYHLADTYLKQGNKKNARAAFEQASKMSFNPKMEEDALFNYAKLSYELSYSPFNETIKAFDQYITKYPNSERNDDAFDYLVKVFMSTKNYREAISSIEKIKVKSPSIREAYQRVTYFRGLELFNDGNYRGALEMLSKSLENSSFNPSYRAQAMYWSAEANYRLGQYQKAIDGFTAFQSVQGAFSLPEFGTAYYNIAYCHFNLKKYEESTVWFRKYLNQSKTTNEFKADANNRIGDFFFLNRDYKEASKFYGTSYNLNSFDPDYALFQRATCLGLEKDHNGKIADLKVLLTKYPNSAFVDDALFEIARSYERLVQEDLAIENYNRLINQVPQSVFVRKALLQLGLIYYNKGEYNASLASYKKVVEKYPNTEDSRAALVGIKNNYIDMNNVDAYFQYSQSTGNVTEYTPSAQDSVFYMAAEKKFMSGDAGAANQMEEYLKRYPDGVFRTNASFYVAESYYSLGQYSKSLELYSEIASKPDNIFTEPSLLKAGELSFNARKYDSSLAYFQRLEKSATTKWNILKARAGAMRSYFKLEDYPNSLKSASLLLTTENITELMIRETNFVLGTSNYKLSNTDEALKYFSLLAQDTKNAEGAEAKYYKAKILYDKNLMSDSETEILDFINKNTPHQFWLAQSFILLSDIYLSKGDLFQAKHTLKSIIDNYTTTTDGIIVLAKEKMDLIEKKENLNLIEE